MVSSVSPIPSGSLQTRTVLTYAEAALTITNQPDITAAIPASETLAYELDLAGNRPT